MADDHDATKPRSLIVPRYSVHGPIKVWTPNGAVTSWEMRRDGTAIAWFADGRDAGLVVTAMNRGTDG